MTMPVSRVLSRGRVLARKALAIVGLALFAGAVIGEILRPSPSTRPSDGARSQDGDAERDDER